MATEPPAPGGQRFSQIYLDRGAPTKDSERFRRRLEAYCLELTHTTPRGLDLRRVLAEELERELGIEKPVRAGAYSGAAVFTSGELRDVLDAVTCVYHFVRFHHGAGTARNWRERVARVMQEENVGYRVDDQCVVHYYVDKEFERSRSATVAVLQHPSLGNALAAFEDAFRHMDAEPRDTKAAVRSMFEAAEVIARQICPESRNLNKWLAENTLKERCIETMPGDVTQTAVLNGMFASLADWVDAIHLYRHGQPADVPVSPSEELAVYVLSMGGAHVRMLAQCYLCMSAEGFIDPADRS